MLYNDETKLLLYFWDFAVREDHVTEIKRLNEIIANEKENSKNIRTSNYSQEGRLDSC